LESIEEKLSTTASSTSRITIPNHFESKGVAVPARMSALADNLYDEKIDFFVPQLYQLLKLLKEVGELLSAKFCPRNDADEGNTEGGENNLKGWDELRAKFLICKHRLTERALWTGAEHPSIEAKEAIIALQMVNLTLRTLARHGSSDIIQSESKWKAETESWKNGTGCFRLPLGDERVKLMRVHFYLTVDRSTDVESRVKVPSNYNTFHCRVTSQGIIE
jgi:hypothetical protein